MPDSTGSVHFSTDVTPHSTVVIGGVQITVQQLQQIYNELTGKSESINKYYDDPIRLEIDDIEQLHHCLMQTWEQYNTVSSNCSFTVYYLKNAKDQFNTFDRFKLQIGGGSEPIESILLKYEFLVILPNLTKAQTYSISIRVTLVWHWRDECAKARPPLFCRASFGLWEGTLDLSKLRTPIMR